MRFVTLFVDSTDTEDALRFLVDALQHPERGGEDIALEMLRSCAHKVHLESSGPVPGVAQLWRCPDREGGGHQCSFKALTPREHKHFVSKADGGPG